MSTAPERVRVPAASVRAPRRITLAIASLGSGGAERVAAILANAWAERGDRATLVTLDDAPSFYALDPRVERVALGLAGASHGMLDRAVQTARRVRALRRAVGASRPDVCVGFIDRFNVMLIAATQGLGVPLVVSERVHPGFVDPRGWGAVRRAFYTRAGAVVAQTERTAAALRWPLSPTVVAIGNPVPEMAARATKAERPRVIAAGRLVPQKGFDVLLRAFARVDAPQWELVIFGEGPERARLEALRGSLGLGDRARLAGTSDELVMELARASIFVLASRFEGFPNVLCEAMAVGLPVIATRCPAGPEEIVREGIDGRLVEVDDVPALARALEELIRSPEQRARMAGAARTISQRYGVARIVAAWDEVFDHVTGGAWKRS
ncbi:MAG: glycosyltransferase family 4 protein [Sandaracinaceae bacterium]|nr:glycosyltransferase family 4 protein [Sandaracinaceae bacterium]